MTALETYCILIALLVVTLVFTVTILSCGTTDTQPVDVGYTIIQDGQNAVKQVGEEVKQVIADCPTLHEPTNVEVNSEGIVDILTDVVNDEASE